MSAGNLLGNLWNKGELPTISTSVEIDKDSIDYLAMMLALAALVIILAAAIVKRL